MTGSDLIRRRKVTTCDRERLSAASGEHYRRHLATGEPLEQQGSLVCEAAAMVLRAYEVMLACGRPSAADECVMMAARILSRVHKTLVEKRAMEAPR